LKSRVRTTLESIISQLCGDGIETGSATGRRLWKNLEGGGVGQAQVFYDDVKNLVRNDNHLHTFGKTFNFWNDCKQAGRANGYQITLVKNFNSTQRTSGIATP
jgi:hypothetical protein